jgi:hypothetical protein
VSLRPDATHAEIADAVAALCPAIDGDLNGERMLMVAPFVFEAGNDPAEAARVGHARVRAHDVWRTTIHGAMFPQGVRPRTAIFRTRECAGTGRRGRRM